MRYINIVWLKQNNNLSKGLVEIFLFLAICICGCFPPYYGNYPEAWRDACRDARRERFTREHPATCLKDEYFWNIKRFRGGYTTDICKGTNLKGEFIFRENVSQGAFDSYIERVQEELQGVLKSLQKELREDYQSIVEKYISQIDSMKVNLPSPSLKEAKEITKAYLNLIDEICAEIENLPVSSFLVYKPGEELKEGEEIP